MTVRCGNHPDGVQVEHQTVEDVRQCYDEYYREQQSSFEEWMLDGSRWYTGSSWENQAYWQTKQVLGRQLDEQETREFRAWAKETSDDAVLANAHLER
jgi:hypothetical protein